MWYSEACIWGFRETDKDRYGYCVHYVLPTFSDVGYLDLGQLMMGI